MTSIIIKYTAVCLLAILAVSCSEKTKKASSSTEKSYLPKAAGEANAILVVMDTALWKEPIGDAQDEPYFKVRNINPLKFKSILKTATNLILVSTLNNNGRMGKKMKEFFTDESLKAIANDTSRFLIKKQNVYANGQEILHLFGPNQKQLIKHLKQNKTKLKNHFIEVENKRIAKSLFKVREKGIENTIQADHGFRLKVPYGYDLSKNLPDFVWIRQLDPEFEKNVFVHFKPYDSQDPFDDVMAFREEITSAYMRDVQKPEIFMTTQPYKEQIREINFNGKYAKECRALWKLSDISGGGPFVSYVFVDESQKRIYYLEGYVYAPGENKRSLMQEIELILQSFKSGADLDA